MTGHTIRLLRESKNIKRYWLAEQLDIDESTLSKIENGQVNISVNRLISISRHLEINIIEFFRDENFYGQEQKDGDDRSASDVVKEMKDKVHLLIEQNMLLLKTIEQNNLINSQLIQALQSR